MTRYLFILGCLISSYLAIYFYAEKRVAETALEMIKPPIISLTLHAKPSKYKFAVVFVSEKNDITANGERLLEQRAIMFKTESDCQREIIHWKRHHPEMVSWSKCVALKYKEDPHG